MFKIQGTNGYDINAKFISSPKDGLLKFPVFPAFEKKDGKVFGKSTAFKNKSYRLFFIRYDNYD